MPTGVRVLVRVRPMLPRELSFDSAVDVPSPVSDRKNADPNILCHLIYPSA